MARQLRWKAPDLVELDRSFRALVNEQLQAAPSERWLYGKELVESKHIVPRFLLPDQEVFVPDESAARYFGDFTRLAGVDHFEAAKPADDSHPAHVEEQLRLVDCPVRRFHLYLSRPLAPDV